MHIYTILINLLNFEQPERTADLFFSSNIFFGRTKMSLLSMRLKIVSFDLLFQTGKVAT